jgi:hypothetical protein
LLKVRLSCELSVQGDSKVDQIFFLSDFLSVDEEFQGWVCLPEGENGVETFVCTDLEAMLLVPLVSEMLMASVFVTILIAPL